MGESERTDAERQAARQAREAARAKRGGADAGSPPPVPPPAPVVPPRPVARVMPPPLALEGVAEPVEEPPPVPRTRAERQPRTRQERAPRTRYLVLGLLIVVILVVGWFAVSLFQPFAGSPGAAVEVTIPPDSSTSGVAAVLSRDHVISSSFFFKIRAELSGDHFSAGTYALARNMTYGEVLSRLAKSPQGPTVSEVTIIPGKSRYQLTQLLRSQGVAGDYSASTLKSPLLNPTRYGAPRDTPSLEGFLYPNTYQLRKPISISALVADQLKEFKQEFKAVDLSYAESKNLTAYDVLIIASLEDAEAAKPSDLAKVASVIYNRLQRGMTLGLDTTAAYAANNYSGNLTSAQLNSHSRWNTTNHPGLPPTPIDSPDIAAIQAAAHPARTDDLYFIVKVCGDGALAFTNSNATFQQLSEQYNASVAKRGADKTEFCSSR